MISSQHSRIASGVRAGLRACLIAVAIGLLLPGSPGVAQSIFANLSGTVTDSTGAIVPSANVSVQNVATNVVRQYVTNGSGFFSATALPTGTYNVTAEAKGFEKWQGRQIVLNGGDDKTLTIPLKPGVATQTVVVSADANEIAVTDTGDKIVRIDSQELNKLSIVGRNATEILKILPGASMNSLGGTNRPAFSGGVVGINGGIGDNVGGLSGVSLNGLGGSGVSLTSDGQNTEDPGSPGNATPINPNPDMISEVTVQTSNFGADNAKGPVVVSTVSKGGSATFHGDARFHARNSVMDAEEANAKSNEATSKGSFSSGSLKIPYHYYYPGGGIGGPIVIPGTNFNKSRTKYQFHESYEYYDQLVASTSYDRDFVPTPAMLNGDFSGLTDPSYKNVSRGVLAAMPTDPGLNPDGTEKNPAFGIRRAQGCSIVKGVLSQACISPMASQIFKTAIPKATSALPNALGYNYIHGVNAPDSSYQNMLHGDINFSDSTKAYVNWSHQSEHTEQPQGLWITPGDWEVPVPGGEVSPQKTDLYTANFLHIFSRSLTVEGRFGYTHLQLPGAPKNPKQVLRSGLNFPQKGVFGSPMAPRISNGWDGGGIPNLGDWFAYYHPQFYVEKQIPSAGADVTKVIRTHTVKAGFFWEQAKNAQDSGSMQYGGVYNYPSWAGTTTGNQYADILMGIGFQSYSEGNFPPTFWNMASIGAYYGTDHWKMTRHITVDYGMRFEHYGPAIPDNKFGAAVFTPSKYQAGVAGSGISWYGLDHSVPKGGFNADLLKFAPRFGAAIDVFGNGKTVVRGGWGVFLYQVGILSSGGSSASGTPYGGISWSCGGSSDCLTWEQIDNHIGTSSGGCAAGTNCAPVVTAGQVQPVKVSSLHDTDVTVADSTNKDNPQTTTYSLNVDQQFPGKFLFEISYVGNHSDYGQVSVNRNSVPLGAMSDQATVLATCPGESGSTPADQFNTALGDDSCKQKFRPFPVYRKLNTYESAQKSQYDALQVSLQHSTGWAILNFNYTWAKSLTNNATSGAFKDWGIHEYWGVNNNDRAQVFNAAYVFELPKVGNGNRWLRGAANGWEFSGISSVQSGQQTTPILNGAQDGAHLVGSPDANVYPVLTCNPHTGLHSKQFLNPTCYALPAVNGSNGIGSGRLPYTAGPAYWNSDATIVKNTKISERQNLEFRFAAFNFLNHALTSFSSGSDGNLQLNFDKTTGKLTNATSTNPCPGPTCSAFGYADSTFGHRVLELGAKYTF